MMGIERNCLLAFAVWLPYIVWVVQNIIIIIFQSPPPQYFTLTDPRVLGFQQPVLMGSFQP